jgi:activator of HSP90 ATPase
MKNFKKYYQIPTTPDQVYLALTVENTLLLWTGEEAVMQNIPETEFSLWNGSIVGKNLVFEEGKKIVQQWYFGEQEEPSIVTLKLHANNKGTSVELNHTNIPDEAYESMVEGWDDTYFAALIDFYE